MQLILPEQAGDELHAGVILSQDGVEPNIDIAFAIDRSGSSGNDTGIDFDGDGNSDTFLEAQIFAAEVKTAELLLAGYDPASINVTIVDYAETANSATFNLASESGDLLAYINGLSSGGTTNYAAALAEVENAWDAAGVSPTDTNILYFYSDGFPVPSGQDFQTPLASLEAAYDPQITAVGFGPNTDDASLDIIVSSGNATIVTTEQELIDLLNTPPPLPDVDSFDVFVDGVLIETIDISDPRVSINPTGITISNLNVTGYTTVDNTEQDLDVQVVANFSNGDTLPVNGPVKFLDGIVEGTTGDDVIDINYEDDPEGDKVDSGDNIDPNRLPEEVDDDVIEAGGGNDLVLAGAGDDTVNGGTGDDTILGGIGEDVLVGDAGDDVLAGNGDDDSADRAFGSDDADLFINFGNGDTIVGGEGGDDNDTLDLTGSGPLTINYAGGDPTAEEGTVTFFTDTTKTTVEGTLTFLEIENVIPCFTPGTLIATPKGERLVEELRPGDRVITRDNGLQEICWVGRRDLSGQELVQAPHLRPVLIRAGSLGHGLPERDMMVSPQHRLLINNDRAALYFEEREVLAAAKHLTGMEGVDRAEVSAVSYIHFMFEHHEVVLSDGAWTESFQPGDQVLDDMGEVQRKEIFDLFPELAEKEGREAYTAARRSLKKHETGLLVQ